jgi:hypothetical protein
MSKITDIIGKVAPTVATVLGGPFAGMAIELLGGALGIGEPTQAKIANVLTNSQLTGDQLLALKKAELDLQAQLEANGIRLEEVAAHDRDSARQREVAVKDWTPKVLALMVTVGFFGVLSWLLVQGKPAQGGDALLVMLGALGGAWTSIIAYYYGSSSGSAQNRETIAKLAAQK